MRTRKTLALFAMAALAASAAAAADLPVQARGATALETLQRAELLAARQSWDGAIAAYERTRPAWRVEVESHGSQGRGPQG